MPHLEADLDDLSPIGTVPMRGNLTASAHVDGLFNRPKPVGDITSLTGFSIADVAFGDLSAGHIDVDVQKPEVDITNVRAKRRESAYEVPTARLRFGGAKGFVVDAVGASGGFGLRDALSMFALEDDPRFEGIDATVAARVDVHVALGGPEDACGGGYLAIDAKGHLRNVELYGERFAQGDADVTFRWYDRERGIAGAEVDLRSFVLDKAEPPPGTRAGANGTVLGSATIRRGGALAANVMLEGVPLSRVDLLGSLAPQVGGSVSGVAHVTGDLDDFRPDAGFVARAEIDVSAARVRDVAVQGSHLDVTMTHRMPQQKRALGHTRCGAPIGPPFDAKAFLADTSSHGEWTLNGDLFGNTVHLRDIVVTRAKAPHVSGRASLRGVDLGAVAGIATPHKSDADDPVAVGARPVAGQLWGELIVDDLPLDNPSKARGRLLLGPTFASRGTDKLTLRPPREPIELADDTLTVPPLEVTLEAGRSDGPSDTDAGFRGGFLLTGGVTKVTSDPTLAFDAKLEPVDLAVLPRLVPKVDSATGKLEGSLRVTGKVAAPTVAGEIEVKADDLEVRGLPGSVTNVRIDVRASASEIAASGTGEFGGGTVSFDGAIPVRGFAVGALDSRIAVRGVHVNRTDGVKAMCDADLHATYDPKAQNGTAGAIPRLTGDVTIDSLEYTRPITMSANLPSFGTRAKRTEVDAYDPALDVIAFDLRVRSAVPIVIKNNLVEVQLGIDSSTLEVTGTNQRIGLRGALRALPSGRLHFQTNEFDVRQALIRFDDPTRMAPNVDITAVTEYRRYTDSSAGAAAGAGSTGGPSAASTGVTRGGSLWRITLHAYGDADNLRVDMTSEPALSQEDIVLLLTVGMTRAELDQLAGEQHRRQHRAQRPGGRERRRPRREAGHPHHRRLPLRQRLLDGHRQDGAAAHGREAFDQRPSRQRDRRLERRPRAAVEHRVAPEQPPQRARIVRQHQRRFVLDARQPRHGSSLAARVRVAVEGADARPRPGLRRARSGSRNRPGPGPRADRASPGAATVDGPDRAAHSAAGAPRGRGAGPHARAAAGPLWARQSSREPRGGRPRGERLGRRRGPRRDRPQARRPAHARRGARRAPRAAPNGAVCPRSHLGARRRQRRRRGRHGEGRSAQAGRSAAGRSARRAARRRRAAPERGPGRGRRDRRCRSRLDRRAARTQLRPARLPLGEGAPPDARHRRPFADAAPDRRGAGRAAVHRRSPVLRLRREPRRR